MSTTTNTTLADLAQRVDSFTEDELASLAGVELTTLDAWRRRRKGPPWVRLGTRVLYPTAGVREHLERGMRNPHAEAALPVGDLL